MILGMHVTCSHKSSLDLQYRLLLFYLKPFSFDGLWFYLVRSVTYAHTTWWFSDRSYKFAEGVVSCIMVGCLITTPQPVYLQYIKNLM